MTVEINQKRPLHLFEGYGVEMEYMIVDSNSLNTFPVSDRLMELATGTVVNEISRNGVAWSNELVLHVIEVKTDGPAKSLQGLGDIFQQEVAELDDILSTFGARLMPGAMHPWMDPFSECRLWPYENNAIYEAYNRIFDCRGHGWANLQSTHLNLPFTGDEEFAKLHAAIRIILPLLPALAASSPIADDRRQDFLDFRMETYRTNSIAIPSITGLIVPEPVFSKEEYEKKIFDVMYADIAPHDPDGILRDEWLNSRGAMSRWDRNAIEIRVLDIQEHPKADIAILEWTAALAQVLVREEWCSVSEQQSWTEQDLYAILMDIVTFGEQAEIHNRPYLSMFGIETSGITSGELCEIIGNRLNSLGLISQESARLLEIIYEQGPLARRILNSLPDSFSKKELYPVYEQLCNCLRDGEPFLS